MFIADVKLSWRKSVSADVARVVVVVTNDGTTTETEVGPEVQDFVIVVRAMGTFSYVIRTYDSEGLLATSVTYSATLGDLTAPQPATELTHEVLGIREMP